MNEKTEGPNYVRVREDLYNALVEDAIGPYIEEEHICGGHHVEAGLEKGLIKEADIKDFEAIMKDLVDNHLTLAADNVEQAVKFMEDRKDFMQAIEPGFKRILDGGVKDSDQLTRNLYAYGKLAGFKEMDVKQFFGTADFAALKAIQDYHFGLIVNIANDLRSSIRDEIFSGVMQGSRIQDIAANIRDLGIQPIRAGGRMLTPYQRGTLIARTETARATMQGNVVALQNYGVDLVEWSDSGDERECGECEDLAANGPYPIDGIPDYPAHPDCRCDIVASTEANIAGEPANPDEFLSLVTGEMTAVDEGAAESVGAVVEEDGSVVVESPEDLNPMSKHAQTYMEDPDKRYANMAKWGEDVNNADQRNIISNIFDQEGKPIGSKIDGPIWYQDRNTLRELFNPNTGEAKTWVQTVPNKSNFRLYTNQSFNPEDIKAMIKGEVPEAIAHNFLGEQYIVSIPDDVLAELRAMSWEDNWKLANKIEEEFLTAFRALEKEAFAPGIPNPDAYVEARLPLLWNRILPNYGLEYTKLDQVDIVRLIETLPIESPATDAVAIEEGQQAYPQYQSDIYGDAVDVNSQEYYTQFKYRETGFGDMGEYQPLPDEKITRQEPFKPYTGVDDSFTRVKPPEIDMSEFDPYARGLNGRVGQGMNDPVIVPDKNGDVWVVKRSNDAEARMEELGWRVAKAMDEPAPDEVIIMDRLTLEATQPDLAKALEFEENSKDNAAVFLRYIDDSEMIGKWQQTEHYSFTNMADEFAEDIKKGMMKDITIMDTDAHAGNWMVAPLDGEPRIFTIDNGLAGPETKTYNVTLRNPYAETLVNNDVRRGIIDINDPASIKQWIEDNLGEYKQAIKDMDISTLPSSVQPWVEARINNIDDLTYYWVKYWGEGNSNIWRSDL